MDNQPYIIVLLDEYANILDYESTIEDLQYDKSGVLGKNWFDIFCNPDDKSVQWKLFKDNLVDKNFWRNMTDIKTQKGKHKLIDFENTILVYDNGKKVLYSEWIEHYAHTLGL